jgi:hypothetical protein
MKIYPTPCALNCPRFLKNWPIKYTEGSRIELKFDAPILRKGIFKTSPGKTRFGAQSGKIYDPGQGRYRNQARAL